MGRELTVEAAKTPPSATAKNGGRSGPARRARSRVQQIRWRDALFRRSLATADVLSVLGALAAVVVVGDAVLTPLVALTPIGFVVLAKAAGLYDRDEYLLHRSTLDEVPSLFGLTTLSTLVLWFLDGAVVDGTLGRGEVLAFWLLLFILILCLRSLARAVAVRLAPTERCLIVADARTADYVREKLAISPAVKAELVGVVSVPDGSRTRGQVNGDPLNREGPHELSAVIAEHDVDRVILTTEAEGRDDLLYVIRELKSVGVKVSVLPETSRVAGSSVELDHLHGITLLGMRRFEITRSSRMVKRSFDIAGSATALALLSPLLLAVAIAIKLDSRGPVLFRQRRVGRNGTHFELVKFRSMVEEADRRKDAYRHLNEGAPGLFKIAGDPRVTRVGRFLRRWQLDELPQLFNVLRGDMSLVGPRPLIEEEDRQIEGWYRRRLDVPPGITGHWQVLGSSSQVSLDEMVKLDYLYAANWSLWGDVRLLLRTVPFMVRRGGM